MDAECKEDKRKSYLESRKQRWSMNSQRLEAIVAELMRPIGDLRRSFDTDLSALLEEYLTEAGLHALDAEGSDAEDGSDLPPHVTPNFAELALLLQQSASIYGRKVDFLYQHVLSVSDSLHTAELLQISNESHTETAADTTGEGGATPSPASRRRSALTDKSWSHIELTACPGATRDASGAPRPPPTLPRAYLELEPRALAACDAPLQDYAGEPVGLLNDFHVAWRLREGMLVEELEPGEAGDAGGAGGLRAIPLTELQAALSAHAPPPLPPTSPLPPSPPPSPPPHASTPLPIAMESPSFDTDSLTMPPPDACKRKRKREPQPEDLPANIKLLIGKELRRELRRIKEFSIPLEWVRDEVRRRSARVLALRRRCDSPLTELRGFEYSSCDADGFPGWSSTAAAEASAVAQAAVTEASTRLDPYSCSDDDGFFEQSSSGDSDEPSQPHHSSADASGEWWSWQAAIAARAQAAEARGLDVRALAARVIHCLPPPPSVCASRHLLATAEDPADVSRVFLATLFLANSGNVEIIQGAPLTTDSFSVRLLSTDERLYSAAAASEAGLLAPGAPAAPAAGPPGPPEPPVR